MCEETGGSVTGSIGELVGEAPNVIVGGVLGVVTAVVLMFVLDNIVWIGLGVGVLAVAGIAWRVRCIVREHRAMPQSALWTPDKAMSVPRTAISTASMPRRVRALPAPQKALPAVQAEELDPAVVRQLQELYMAVAPALPEAVPDAVA